MELNGLRIAMNAVVLLKYVPEREEAVAMRQLLHKSGLIDASLCQVRIGAKGSCATDSHRVS